MTGRTEAQKQRRRAQEMARRQRQYNPLHRPRPDGRPRCSICSEVVYGKGGTHPQCSLREAEARVPE